MTTAAQPATQRRRLSRDDVLRLGRSGAPWGFVPVAAQVLRLAPDDHVVRAMMAANLAVLGLKTAALDVIELLPERARRDSEVAHLEQATRALPGEVIPAEELIRTCRANLAALPSGAEALETVVAEWERELGAWEWMRARGGNIVRRQPGSEDVARWRGLCDQTGAAEGFARRHFATDEDTHGPLTIEGLDPPWIFLGAVKAFPARADGFVRRIRVVQADAMELLDGLAHADLTEPFSSGRVELFAGADCTERLAARLSALHAVRIQGPYVPLLSLRTKAEPAVDAVLRDAARAQEREHESLQAVVRDKYAGRDAAWWRRRYRGALGGGEPLRVLVPTCRYSTFIQHSSRDLVGAFERAGCEAELLIEPDPFSHFSLVAYERTIARFEPDLVVLINYARRTMPDAFPDNVPFVCWIQDAMPHLYNEEIGQAQGDLDFLCGHLHEDMFRRYGYPLERAMAVPVVASADKFHPGPVDESLRKELECEVACVTHHSETPEAMQRRLCTQAGDNADVPPIFEALQPRLRDLVESSLTRSAWFEIPQLVSAAAKEVLGREPDEHLVFQITSLYATPMADRLTRHQTLRWAADLAQKHGWRLHLYGRGWESHPRLAAYAKGELAHGEVLRASYQSALVHLHATANTLVHQRVLECALSGGLPLCRLHADALMMALWRAQRGAAMGRHPAYCDIMTRRPGYRVADSPEAMALTAMLQRLRLDHGWALWVGAQERELLVRYERLIQPDYDALLLLVDPAQTTFASREQLEQRIEHATSNPRWRAGMSAAIAGRVRRRLTHDVLARRMIRLVKDGLGDGDKTPNTPRSADALPPDAPTLPDPATMCTLQGRCQRLRGAIQSHRLVRRRFELDPDEGALRRVADLYAPPGWVQGAITIEDGLFLYDMVRCVGPRRIIEIGAGSGASAALLLHALADAGVPPAGPDGSPTLHCFDLHPFCYFDRSRPVGSAVAEMAPDLAGGMALHIRKAAIDAGAMFAGQPVDLAFIDGDHRHPWPTADLLALLPALRPGAWVVLHDIELPEYARRYEAAHDTVVNWRQAGAQWLFDAWPHEKIRGRAGAYNIGAIRIPVSPAVSADDLRRVIDMPWETTLDERACRLLREAG